MFPAAAEGEGTVDDLGAFDGELGHDAVFVFDLDRQFVMRQNIARMIEDRGQFAGVEAMIEIVMHPGLQQAGLQRAPSAAAVDEMFAHHTYFCDVKMRWDSCSII